MVLCIAKYKFYYIYLQYNETNAENRLIPLDMKKTIHVNIGGMPFVLDEDAYDALKRYLSEIEIRLDGVDDQETDRKSTRLNSSHKTESRMPSSA